MKTRSRDRSRGRLRNHHYTNSDAEDTVSRDSRHQRSRDKKRHSDERSMESRRDESVNGKEKEMSQGKDKRYWWRRDWNSLSKKC